MSLFWLTFDTAQGRAVWIQEAHEPSMARLKASMAGAPEDFKEYLQLDEKTAKKIPKNLIGKTLKNAQANALLKKLA
jgi:hypothetical protein